MARPYLSAHAGAAIDVWVDHWNDDPKPFIWKKSAEEILAKVQRGRATLTHQTNSGDGPLETHTHHVRHEHDLWIVAAEGVEAVAVRV